MVDYPYKLLSCFTPTSVLLLASLWMLSGVRNDREIRWWVRILLCMGGGLETAVIVCRFGGISLASRPWVGGLLLVVDPFLEWVALVGAAMLFAMARGGLSASEPWRGARNFLIHAAILLPLFGTLVLLRLDRGISSASPDGRYEARIFPAYCPCGCEMTGLVVYRRHGALAWKFVIALDEEDGEASGARFSWSPDSKTVSWVPARSEPRGGFRFRVE